MTVWGARTATPLDLRVWAFLKADDAELLSYDCRASRVHAERLAAAGLVTAEELVEIEAALDRIAAGSVVAPDDEDVHSAIERELGPLGRKIHAGRSRNDQVAAAFRLYVGDASAEAVAAIEAFAGRRPRPGRGRGGHAHARVHAPAARAARHGRAPPARLGRDARPARS